MPILTVSIHDCSDKSLITAVTTIIFCHGWFHKKRVLVNPIVSLVFVSSERDRPMDFFRCYCKYLFPIAKESKEHGWVWVCNTLCTIQWNFLFPFSNRKNKNRSKFKFVVLSCTLKIWQFCGSASNSVVRSSLFLIHVASECSDVRGASSNISISVPVAAFAGVQESPSKK